MIKIGELSQMRYLTLLLALNNAGLPKELQHPKQIENIQHTIFESTANLWVHQLKKFGKKIVSPRPA